MKLKISNLKIAIIGLGYVGLPLAIEFGKKIITLGFDINVNRINKLKKKFDENLEIEKKDFDEAKKLTFSSNINDLSYCNCFIITVPTPITKKNKPDLTLIKSASKLVSKNLEKGSVVIYESTVYPGLTEEICVPILEKFSKLKFNKDFFVGYSPERINPGDKKHKLKDVIKITSGSNPEIASLINQLYSIIVTAGTYPVKSIKVAEAAKVIENAQRDINIAFVNELSIIFNKLKIDTQEVLDAAATKWNFLKFHPGLVGGHCIGVDPFYLTYKSKMLGYNPNVILAGRKINDHMSSYVTAQLISSMKKKKIILKKSKILILGLTFKENCPDTRNSKIFDIIKKLKKIVTRVDVYDPYIKDVSEFNFILKKIPTNADYDAVLIAVKHDIFLKLTLNKIKKMCKSRHVIYDLKNVLPGLKSIIYL